MPGSTKPHLGVNDCLHRLVANVAVEPAGRDQRFRQCARQLLGSLGGARGRDSRLHRRVGRLLRLEGVLGRRVRNAVEHHGRAREGAEELVCAVEVHDGVLAVLRAQYREVVQRHAAGAHAGRRGKRNALLTKRIQLGGNRRATAMRADSAGHTRLRSRAMRRARSLAALLRAAAPCAPPAVPPRAAAGALRRVSASAVSRLNDRDGQFEELLERTLVRPDAP